MQIVITIDDIDYGDFVERYYPLVKDRIQGGEGMGAIPEAEGRCRLPRQMLRNLPG